MSVSATSCAAFLLLFSIIVFPAKCDVIDLDIGKYEFFSDDLIASGSYGEVFKATKVDEHAKGPADIAIKIHKYGCKEIKNEADVYVKLGLAYNSDRTDGHPKGFPVFYQYGVHNGKKFIAIQFIDGNFFKRKESFSLKDSLIIQEQLLERLKYIHSHGLACCDIKPENLSFINGVLYIFDFGFVKSFIEKGTHFRLYSNCIRPGATAYMSVRSFKNRDFSYYPRDDIEAASLLISVLATDTSLPWAAEKELKVILTKKLKTPLLTLFPKCLEALVLFAEYARSLPPYERIDYDFLQNLINEAKLNHDIPLDADFGTTTDTTPEKKSKGKPQQFMPHPDIFHPTSYEVPDDEFRFADYGGPTTEVLLLPNAPSERVHGGPCPSEKGSDNSSHAKSFEMATEIYAKGLKYVLKKEYEITNGRYKPIKVYEINRLGHIFYIKISRTDETTHLADVLQNEKFSHEIMEARMKSLIETKEEWPFGVPVPVAHGYQTKCDYTITQLPEGEPLSMKKYFSNKMIIQMGLEAFQLEIIAFFHITLGMVLIHISKESFWVSRFGRNRRIVWCGVSGAQSFHFNVLKPVNLDAFDPYDSKTCMAIGAHEGNDYIPAYDIESLGWMMYLLFSFQDQSNSKSDTPRNNLLLFKKQILANSERPTDALLALIKYANGLNYSDSIDFKFLKDLLRLHPDYEPNFDWVNEEIVAAKASSKMGLAYHYINLLGTCWKSTTTKASAIMRRETQ